MTMPALVRELIWKLPEPILSESELLTPPTIPRMRATVIGI
jgi:hypothetical protein